MPEPAAGSTTNRAAVLERVGMITMEDRPMPRCQPDEVIVKVEAVGLCGSDVHYYRHGRIGSFVLESPLILGHETAGTVVEIGSSVSTLAPGTRVAIEPGVPCGTCELCRQGHYNVCAEVVFHATPPVDGTLQEYVAVRADYAIELPDAVSTQEGALIEPLAVAVWAARRASIEPGDRVLVTGAGPVGLLALQVAASRGASVVVTDIDRRRLSLALELGAEGVFAPDDPAAQDGNTFDVLLECSGSLPATRAGLHRLAALGRAVLIGMGSGEDLKIPVSLLQERELLITGIFRYANCYPTAIGLVASGKVKVAPLITGLHPLSGTAAAIESNGHGDGMKTVITPAAR